MGRLLPFKTDFKDLLNVPFSHYDAQYALRTGLILQQLTEGSFASENPLFAVMLATGRNYVFLRERACRGFFEEKTVKITPEGAYLARGESAIGIERGNMFWTVKRGTLTDKMVADSYLAIKAGIAGFAKCRKNFSKRQASEWESQLEAALSTGEINYDRSCVISGCTVLANT